MKKVLLIALACAGAFVPGKASADVNDTTIVNVRVLSGYVEIKTSAEACPGAGLTGNWSFYPRVEHSTGSLAEGVRQLALAAMLAGKKVDIKTSVQSTMSGNRCFINDFTVKGS